MNLSGIVVATRPQSTSLVVDRLGAIDGVQVYNIDQDTGRIVVVQEASSIDDEVAGLKRIQSVPDVAMAEMVYHYFAEDDSLATKAPGDMSKTEPIDESILERLSGEIS